MTSYDPRAEARRAANTGAVGYTDIPGTGLLGFAVLMLGLAGAWNVIEGLLAIGDSRVFVGETTFVFSDLNTWGCDHAPAGHGDAPRLVLHPCRQRARTLVRDRGRPPERDRSAVLHDGVCRSAITMLAIDIVIIYALAVYGGKRLRTE